MAPNADGRKAALTVLDDLIGDELNLQTLAAAMQEEFDKDPVEFYKKIVMPLTPKPVERPGELNEGVNIQIVMVEGSAPDANVKAIESNVLGNAAQLGPAISGARVPVEVAVGDEAEISNEL